MRFDRLAHCISSAILMAVLELLPVHVFAQGYPTRGVITAIYPASAGGTGDVAFRLIMEETGKILGQRFIVENRPGVGGKIGFSAMMKLPPDGYAIAFIATPTGVNLPLSDPTYRIEPGKDYTPIAAMFDSKFVITVNPSMPFKTVKGLVEYAKANPGKLSYASNGVGTAGHLGIELLKLHLGLYMVHIPYKGEGSAIADVVAGTVQVSIGTGIMKPFIDSGRMLAIATTGKDRWPLYPNVPTLRESGIDQTVTSWTGVAGPPGMSDDVTNALAQAVNAALNQPGVRKRLDDFGLSDFRATPAEFGNFIRAELRRWANVVKAANIQLN